MARQYDRTNLIRGCSVWLGRSSDGGLDYLSFASYAPADRDSPDGFVAPPGSNPLRVDRGCADRKIIEVRTLLFIPMFTKY